MSSSASQYCDDIETRVYEKRRQYLRSLIPPDLYQAIISTDYYKNGGILLINRYRLNIDLYVGYLQIYDTSTRGYINFNIKSGQIKNEKVEGICGDLYGDPRYYLEVLNNFKDILRTYYL